MRIKIHTASLAKINPKAPKTQRNLMVTVQLEKSRAAIYDGLVRSNRAVNLYGTNYGALRLKEIARAWSADEAMFLRVVSESEIALETRNGSRRIVLEDWSVAAYGPSLRSVATPAEAAEQFRTGDYPRDPQSQEPGEHPLVAASLASPFEHLEEVEPSAAAAAALGLVDLKAYQKAAVAQAKVLAGQEKRARRSRQYEAADEAAAALGRVREHYALADSELESRRTEASAGLTAKGYSGTTAHSAAAKIEALEAATDDATNELNEIFYREEAARAAFEASKSAVKMLEKQLAAKRLSAVKRRELTANLETEEKILANNRRDYSAARKNTTAAIDRYNDATAAEAEAKGEKLTIRAASHQLPAPVAAAAAERVLN